MDYKYKVVKYYGDYVDIVGVFSKKESANELKCWLDEGNLSDDIKYDVEFDPIVEKYYQVVKEYKNGSFIGVISNIIESDAIVIKNLLNKKNGLDTYTYKVVKQWSME